MTTDETEKAAAEDQIRSLIDALPNTAGLADLLIDELDQLPLRLTSRPTEAANHRITIAKARLRIIQSLQSL